MIFKIGDIVKCVSGAWLEDTEGLVGTIVTYNEQYGFGIDYGYNEQGKPHYYMFHNLSGKLKGNTGYWIKEKDLELVNTKKGNYKNYV